MSNSRFTAGLGSLIAHRIVAGLMIFFTLGIATPWAIVFLQRWETTNTIIDGRRLYFDGSAMGLFGQWIKWLLLTFVTFGIYGFWVSIKMKQWVVSHTHFES